MSIVLPCELCNLLTMLKGFPLFICFHLLILNLRESINLHLALNNLLHVSSITKNLFSVSKFAQDNNIYFDFFSHNWFAKSQESNDILLHGCVDSDGLFQF